MSKLVTDSNYADNYDENREEDEMESEETCETYELIRGFQEKYFYRINKAVGNRLKLLRILHGMTVKDLAKKLHISIQQISKYEKGINAISPGRMMIICKTLGVSPIDFYKDLETYNIDLSISFPEDSILNFGNSRMLSDICLHFGKLRPYEQKGLHALLKSLVEK